MAQSVALAFRIAANLTEFRANLAEAQAQLETTKQAMQRMANGFDGSKIIADGNAIVKVVTDIGGASKLTETEQARVNAVVTEAVAKYEALGRVAPKGLRDLADATEHARQPTDELHTSFQKFDSILASLGITIGSEVKGLGELTTAAGKSASDLGTLATAGLAAAAAVGGWKIGRMVSEFFDLDKAIGDVAARLLGFGDVAAQEAGAKADILAKASASAGIEIKSLTLAMAINEDVAKKHAEAFNTSEMRVAGWRGELEKARADGTLDKITRDLASQNFEVKELADRYHVSVDALQYYAREQKKADDAIEAGNKRKIQAIAEEMEARKAQADLEARTKEQVTRLWDEYDTLRVSHGGTATANLRAQTDQWANDLTAKMKRMGTDSDAFYTALAAVSREKMESIRLDWGHYTDYSNAKLQEVADRERALYQEMLLHASEFSRGAIQKQREVADAARDAATAWGNPWNQELDAVAAKAAATAAAIQNSFEQTAAAVAALQGKMTGSTSITYDLSTDEGMAFFKKANPGAYVNVGTDYFKTHTLQDAVQAGLIDVYAGLKKQYGFGDGFPHFADGVRNFAGGMALVGERGPEIVNLPRGADVIPNGRIGGGVNVTVQVTQPLGTPAQIADAVGDALVYKLRSIGVRLPVGV